MDLPAQGLYQQMHARQISGEHLEVLGKQASDRWLAGQHKTLTESVVESVKHAGLSPEQVRRVVEFANTDAFQREFKKESALHRVVHFAGGPADPGDVLRDLNDGGGGSVFDRGTSDYNQPPGEKTSSARAEEALFGMLSGSEAPLPEVSPLGDAVALRDKLAAMNDHMTSELSGLEVMFGDLSERLFDGVKQAALGGVPLGFIASAFESVAPSEDHIKVAFGYLAPRLLHDGVFSSMEAMDASVEKTAGARIPNPSHPLLVDFVEYCESLSKLAETRAAQQEVRVGLNELTQFLKAAGKGILPKAWQALGSAGEVAGKAVAPIAEHLYTGSGGRAADVTRKAVQYGVPLIAANEVRRQLKYSPAFQGVKDTALSVVPMTPQYQQREYEIATGM